MESSRTITELKSSFIRSQIRILSSPLEPSPEWRDFGSVTEDDISDKTVEDVLQKLRTIFKQHNRAVYSSQAIHHVSRQIERLYWNSINPELGGENGQVVEKGTDLTNSRSIVRLPAQWTGNDASEEDKSRYTRLHERLLELDAQRKEEQQLLAQYKLLETLLEPFKDPQSNIQPNLVTRDSQLGEELDRMRMLVAKISSRLEASTKMPAASEQHQMLSMDLDTKLSALLDM